MTTHTPQRVAIYARISLDQSGKHLGVKRQLEACERYAEDRGWHIVDRYVDNSVSATSGVTRPEYRRMLAEGQADRFDLLLGWDSDRIVRLLSEAVELMAVVRDGAFDVATVNGGSLDLSSAGGRLVFKILTAVAEMEIEHKRERAALADEQRRKLGKQRWGRRPFGFNRDGTMHVTEGPILQGMIQRYIAGDKIDDITNDLRDAGVVQTTGSPFTSQRVVVTVCAPRNAALYPDGKPGGWTALIDAGTHAQVLAIRKGRRKGPRGDEPYLLSGYVRCGRCGLGMFGQNQSDKPGRMYVCRKQTTNNQHGCGMSAQEHHVNDVVEQAAIEILADPVHRGRLVAAQSDTDAAFHLEEIDKAKAGRQRILDRIANGRIEPGEADDILEDLVARITSHQNALSGNGLASVLQEVPSGDEFPAYWAALTVREKAVPIRELFAPIVIEPNAKHPGRYFNRDRVKVTERG